METCLSLLRVCPLLNTPNSDGHLLVHNCPRFACRRKTERDTRSRRASGDTRGLDGAMTLVLNNAQAKPVPSYTAGLLHSISQPRTLSSPGRVSIPPRCTGIRAAEGTCESPRRTRDRAVRHPERAGSRDERGRSASGTRLRAREAAVVHRVRGRAQGLQMARTLAIILRPSSNLLQ